MRRTTTHSRLASAALLFVTHAMAADNLACNGTGMNWYTDMVGETPCQTYQKLRQICNAQYTVGVQNVNTPPDSCSDQVSTCCCNTIAFSLSMLCLNCQQDIGTGTGFDAGVGAYQDYLGQCGSPQTFKLPRTSRPPCATKRSRLTTTFIRTGGRTGRGSSACCFLLILSSTAFFARRSVGRQMGALISGSLPYTASTSGPICSSKPLHPPSCHFHLHPRHDHQGQHRREQQLVHALSFYDC
ncbi:hypothetical protein B0H13DRAFT_927303 [Mycena leptocephala]|nr:hypothetical protein B0H13DRAFT_927303 [Mycena leptocephala]